jgi:hypothetical protein
MSSFPFSQGYETALGECLLLSKAYNVDFFGLLSLPLADLYAIIPVATASAESIMKKAKK